MRITYFLPDLGFTGGSQVLYQFMERLSERDHEVFLVTPGGRVQWRPGLAARINRRAGEEIVPPVSGEAFSGEELAAAGDAASLSLGVRPGRLAFSSLVTASLTEGLLRHWLPSDVTIATHNFTAQAAFHLMDRTRPFYHVQAYEENFTQDPSLQKLARLTYFLPLRLLANSGWLAGRLKELTGRRPELLFPGVDRRVFRPRPEDAGKFGAAGEFRVLSFYSAAPYKGWKTAAQAMRLAARASGRPLKWVVLGGDPGPVEGVDAEFPGKAFGADLAALYSGCHVCLTASSLESFPLPPLEAMACGTAVVTTAAGSGDYVKDGENALLIPPGDPGAAAAALLRLERDPGLCRSLAAEGLRTAERFNWDNAVKRLELLLADEVSTPARARAAAAAL